MKERQWKLFSIFAGLSLLLFQYQNCGKTSIHGQADATNDSQVGIINPINTGSIQFLEKKTQISEQETQIVAYGICAEAQEGALLSWKLLNQDGDQILSSGKSLCDRGAFEVISNEVVQANCGSTLRLTAFLGSQEKTELLVEKKCL